MRPTAKEVLELLTPLVDDPSVDVRRGASLSIAVLASTLEPQGQRETIWSLLEHSSWAVRRSGAIGLGLIAKSSNQPISKEIGEKLFQIVNDRDHSVRWGAGVGLGLALPEFFPTFSKAEKYLDKLIAQDRNMVTVIRGICLGLGMAIIYDPHSYAFHLLKSIMRNKSDRSKFIPNALQGLSYGAAFLPYRESLEAFSIFQEDLIQNPTRVESIYGLGFSTMNNDHSETALQIIKSLITNSASNSSSDALSNPSSWRIYAASSFSLIAALSTFSSPIAVEDVINIIKKFPERALEASTVSLGLLSMLFEPFSQKEPLFEMVKKYHSERTDVKRGLGIALGLLGASQDTFVQHLKEDDTAKSGALLGLSFSSSLSDSYPEILKIITPYLNHKNASVRWSVCYALAFLTTETVGNSIPTEVFLGIGETIPGWWVRGICLTSIGLIKRLRNRELFILNTLVTNPERYFSDPIPLIRACALRQYFQTSKLHSESINILKDFLQDLDPLVSYIAADLVRKHYLEKPETFSNLLMSLDLSALSRLGEVSRQSLFESLSSPLFQNNYIAKLNCVRLLEQLINFLPDIYSATPLQEALVSENDAYIREYLEKILMKLHEFLSN
ncbi:MAG: HEAT repeat domain-containing protein [Candidatus Hermodarchaeota archaeon]